MLNIFKKTHFNWSITEWNICVLLFTVQQIGVFDSIKQCLKNKKHISNVLIKCWEFWNVFHIEDREAKKFTYLKIQYEQKESFFLSEKLFSKKWKKNILPKLITQEKHIIELLPKHFNQMRSKNISKSSSTKKCYYNIVR